MDKSVLICYLSKDQKFNHSGKAICEEKDIPSFTKGQFCICFEDYCNHIGLGDIGARINFPLLISLLALGSIAF